jgi:hypothetical protein
MSYVCPMDPDIRAAVAGKCSRCGMALRPLGGQPRAYRLEMRETASAGAPSGAVALAFEVTDPESGERVTQFETVHEMLFHLLAVSEDLNHFLHEHPVLGPDGIFRINLRLPQPGAYRMLCDFYPQGGFPQAIIKKFNYGPETTHKEHASELKEDLSAKRGYNLGVSLRTKPNHLTAGEPSQLLFDLDDFRGLQPYLGAWAHMLIASWDTHELIHAHPTVSYGRKTTQFDLVFPRAGYYRMWVQFQRQGVVNTVAFTIQARQRV